MWSSRLFWRLFGTFALAIVGLAAVFLTVVTSWQERQTTQLVENQLLDTAVLLRGHVLHALSADDDFSRLQHSVGEFAEGIATRCTVIAPDGTVLADTQEDPGAMENHKNRPEFVQAATGKTGLTQRTSATQKIPMKYLALPVDDGPRRVALVRVALPLDDVEQHAALLRRRVWLIAVGLSALVLLAIYLSVRRIVQPVTALTDFARAVAAGQPIERISIANRGDEFGTLAEAFRSMNTELVRRLAELRSNAQQLRTVLGSMIEGVIAIDARQRVAFANQAAKQLLTIQVADPEGKPLWEIVRSAGLDRAVDEALTDPLQRQFEIELDGKATKILALNVTELPDGDATGLVLVFHDVTELRRLELLRREFVANVSHELKTPLSSIKAYAETLLGGAIHDTQYNLGFVQRIAEQAERLDLLIRDLLSLAQIEAGQQPFEIVDIDLNTAIPQWVPEHARRAKSKEIELQLVHSDGPLSVRADAEGLREILDNLLANAIKYTPQGGRVTVRWFSNDGAAIVEVEDTGIGIARAEQERIFERFYRVDRARSRELGGTGLGLSIVKHLTQAFGGTVSVRSQVGKGSTFVVVFPVAERATS